MNELIEIGKTISVIGGSDGPTSIFLAGKVNIGVLAAAALIGILICFFGLKLARVLSVIVGFAIGTAAGGAAATVTGVTDTLFLVILIGGGALFAVLSLFLFRFGVFCTVFVFSAGAVMTVVKLPSLPVLIIILALSLILSIVAVIYAEPILIIITAIFGGLASGTLIAQIAGLVSPVWLGYAIGAGIAIIGMLIQFMMHSRKIGKKEKVYASEIKEKASVESEVEKARNILEEDEEEE